MLQPAPRCRPGLSAPCGALRGSAGLWVRGAVSRQPLVKRPRDEYHTICEYVTVTDDDSPSHVQGGEHRESRPAWTLWCREGFLPL